MDNQWIKESVESIGRPKPGFGTARIEGIRHYDIDWIARVGRKESLLHLKLILTWGDGHKNQCVEA